MTTGYNTMCFARCASSVHFGLMAPPGASDVDRVREPLVALIRFTRATHVESMRLATAASTYCHNHSVVICNLYLHV